MSEQAKERDKERDGRIQWDSHYNRSPSPAVLNGEFGLHASPSRCSGKRIWPAAMPIILLPGTNPPHCHFNRMERWSGLQGLQLDTGGIRGPEPHTHTHTRSVQTHKIHTSAVLQIYHTHRTVIAQREQSHNHTTQRQVIILRGLSNFFIKWQLSSYFSLPFFFLPSIFILFFHSSSDHVHFIGFENPLLFKMKIWGI